MISCIYCNKETKNKKFCNHNCYSLNKKKGVNKTCVVCSTVFYCLRSRIKKNPRFCSQKCFGKSKELYHARRRVDSNGYVRISVPKNFPNSQKRKYGSYDEISEHVYIMQQNIGRPLKKGEVVHHINHNKQDNRIENLYLCEELEHQRIHKGWNNNGDNWYKTCKMCGVYMIVNKNNFYIYNRKNGKKTYSTYCKSCENIRHKK